MGDHGALHAFVLCLSICLTKTFPVFSKHSVCSHFQFHEHICDIEYVKAYGIKHKEIKIFRTDTRWFKYDRDKL
jgi:hypothetical protein